MPHALWSRLAAAAPDVELVPVEGWVEADRATKEPAEVERIAAACAVADRALAGLLPEIEPGLTESDIALRLEWRIRTGGAEALAFDVACLSGPEAALPHGSPGDRPIRAGAVLLFDFGAQVAGYRSDMTRTLFVGEPAPRDLDVYELVARAQAAAIAALEDAVRAGDGPLPSGRAVDAVARDVIAAAGHGDAFRARHRSRHRPRHARGAVSRTTGARTIRCRVPTVFSVEPGVYLDGETGVRIEDLVLLDAGRRSGRAPDTVSRARSSSSGRSCRRRRRTGVVGRGVCYDRARSTTSDPAGTRVTVAARPAGRHAQEPIP